MLGNDFAVKEKISVDRIIKKRRLSEIAKIIMTMKSRIKLKRNELGYKF